MADQEKNRDSQPAGDKVQTDKGIVLPDSNAEFSDDAPTVISKAVPLAGPKTTAITLIDALGGNLRGRTLAHFELEEAIGVGGMAAVIRARDRQLDRSVALKILPPEMAGDQENVRRFHQEARSAAKLDHENIARAFYCGEDQNLHFIAFEFVEGDNLRAILEKRGKLPVSEAVRYMLQIATGLEHAASRGVVHRDIKPSNIIITPTGRAKLVDMGLARSLHPHDDKALTQSGVTLGTFDYISPEQALEPRDADARSDIYSLGCTFYQMLTGQAPVPEGTAAKKLHHHQHVPPIDPRQLNPDIPDEVAAVLARMMAKNPKDRYQRPLHLVQHLMQVAQKVGAADDVPEGVLFVDAPLPNAPRKRPLLMASLASLFLGLLLFLLSLAPSGQVAAPTYHKDGPKPGPIVKGNSNQGNQKPLPTFGAEDEIVLNTPADLENLRKILEQRDRPLVKIVVANPELDLTDNPLIINGRVLAIEAAKDAAVTLKLRHQGSGEEPSRQFGILVEGGKVEFRNLRFEIETKATPKALVAGVGVRNGGVVSFKKCTFVQAFPKQPLVGLKRVPLASVAIDNGLSGNKLPQVLLEECFFEIGQDAVAVYGAGEVSPSNCAFGPHGALFHLRDDKGEAESILKLRNCSARGINGPVFRLDENARCRLQVDYSIFSRGDDPLIFGDDPAFIRQTDASRPHVRFFSKRNCYHNLNVMWGMGPKIILPEDFKSAVVKAHGGAESAREVSSFLPANQSPWAYSDPYDSKDKLKFFQVRFNLAEVRDAGEILALGVQKCVWGNMTDLPRLENIATGTDLKPFQKVVDPETSVEIPKPGYFQTLAQAIEAAKPGDVIFIKHSKENRHVVVKPKMLDKPDTDLTLKPYAGFQPILTLDVTPEDDAALFKLYHGKLRLENLEFLLKPAHTSFKSQAVVAMHGNGVCTFESCVFTLKQLEGVPLRVVGVENPKSAMNMKMSPKDLRPAPKITFQNCLVRGEGELLRILASRPLDLELGNSLVALTGTMLSIHGNTEKTLMEPGVNLKMSHVSAFLNEPLLALRASTMGTGMAITKVDAKDCLFAALASKSLIHLDGLGIEESQLEKYFTWSGTHNAYCRFEMMLDQKRPDGEIMTVPAIRKNPQAWKMFTNEDDAKYVQARFALTRPLYRALLDDFRPLPEPKVDLQGYGEALNADKLPPLAAPPQEKATVEQPPEIRTPGP